MLVNFSKKEEDLSPEDAYFAYKHLIDLYWHFLRQHSDREFFYWKIMGLFTLTTFASYFLHNYGMVPTISFGVFIPGIGCFLLLMLSLRRDFKDITEVALCVDKGLLMEKEHDYPALFGVFEKSKLTHYRIFLLARLFPMSLVWVATTIAAALLALKVGYSLAIAVAVFSIVVFGFCVRTLIKTARKAFLKETL